jgi:hypothetical protein
MSDTSKTMPAGRPDEESAIRISDDGRGFDYPSTRAEGHDTIEYARRAPSIAGKPGALQNTSVKMRDLPGKIVGDLTAAHRDGNLRAELDRHLSFLEANEYADKGTLAILRNYQADLTGLYEPDSETLDCITGVIQTLRPEERQP